jgi:hypothetical protein
MIISYSSSLSSVFGITSLNYLDEASRFVIGYGVSDESTNITVLEDSFTRYGKILELLSEPLMKFRDGLETPLISGNYHLVEYKKA